MNDERQTVTIVGKNYLQEENDMYSILLFKG